METKRKPELFNFEPHPVFVQVQRVVQPSTSSVDCQHRHSIQSYQAATDGVGPCGVALELVKYLEGVGSALQTFPAISSLESWTWTERVREA